MHPRSDPFFQDTGLTPHDSRRVPPRRSRAHRLDRGLSRARRARGVSRDGAQRAGRAARRRCQRRRRRQPEDFAAIRRDLDALILPACTHWQDPRFHGYFPSNGLPAAVLGDLVSTGLGQLGLNWQSSPALTELEEVCLDWWRQMLGLSERWSGVIQDTASTATFVALVCARERASNHAATRGGLQGAGERRSMVYVSSQAHSSVEKAALLAGFGRENLRVIPVDANFDMRADALAAAIATDRAAGREPCAIVATCGTHRDHGLRSASPRSRRSRAREELWLHVDAAMAGSRDDPARVPRAVGWRRRRRLAGGESAQVARRVDGLLHLLRARSAVPGARHVHQPELPADRGRWPGEELSRLGHSARPPHARAQAVVRDPRSGRDAACRRASAAISPTRNGWPAKSARAPHWKILAPVRLQTLVVRHEPPGLDAAAIDAHTRAWAQAVNESGEAYLTPAVIDGQVGGARLDRRGGNTEHEHVVDLWRLMRDSAGA